MFALTILVLPYANQVFAYDDGFSLGTYYKYSGTGADDFKFTFYNNGFDSSNGFPEQIVLTASSAKGYSYQVSLWITNATNAIEDSEVWDINSGQNIHRSYTYIPNVSNSWHSLELRAVKLFGANVVEFYFDNSVYDMYDSSSAFDNEEAPNVVIESKDTNPSDWQNRGVEGYLEMNGNPVSTYFYGGTWGTLNAGCTIPTSYQSEYLWVGQNIEAPNNVGVTGDVLTDAPKDTFYIGNFENLFAITDKVQQDDYTALAGNSCTVPVS